MSSRDQMLKRIAKAKPSALPLPERFVPPRPGGNLTQKFIAVLQSIGGTAERIDDLQPVNALLAQKAEEGLRVVNVLEPMPSWPTIAYASAAELNNVHTVLIKGGLAVAENGAVWVSESAVCNRLLPFICQQLVMVVQEKSIVADMHEAYNRIAVNGEGYGVFIAGPSKTADIEQSLVVGAHGPLALTVFIIKQETEL